MGSFTALQQLKITSASTLGVSSSSKNNYGDYKQS